jgi:Siphovirus ReqiPepy6 Gp37-like protein
VIRGDVSRPSFDQRSTSDWGELSQAGKDAIAQGAATARMSITALDLSRLAFGADYGLGDKVTVEIAPEVTYPDIVTAVQLTAEGHVETVTPVIGAADSDSGEDSTATARLAARVRALERQLKTLHTRQ